MAERGKWSENASISDQNVEATIALMESAAEPVDSVEVLQIERHQRRGTTNVTDFVVEFFKTTDGASECDDMGTGRSERQRRGRTNSTRGTRHECDAVGQGFGHGRGPMAPRAGILGLTVTSCAHPAI